MDMYEHLVLDVSDWQEGLDYGMAKNLGAQGLIVKANEGTSLASCLYTHINGAVANGMSTGVYTFSRATTTDEAVAEAQCVLQAIKDASIPVPRGIWFDMESDENKSAADPTAVASAFIVECNKAGYSAGIYASLSFFSDYLNIYQLADYVPYWCAQYADKCDFIDTFNGKSLYGWQYTDKFDVGGITCDANKWYAWGVKR